MAEGNKSHEYETKVGEESGAVETKDRGLFDFLGKKEEEKPQEEVIATDFEEKLQVSEPETKVEEEHKKKEEEEKKPTLFEKLHRSGSSSSSSSSDEEEGDDEEKKKKKKEKRSLKEKMKISGEKGEEKEHEDTSVPVEVVHTETPHEPEDKKGFLDKIKEKLPGHKKADEVPPPAPEYVSPEAAVSHEGDAKEKKGLLEKIKEKLPGYHPKTEEEKEKEKESASQ